MASIMPWKLCSDVRSRHRESKNLCGDEREAAEPAVDASIDNEEGREQPLLRTRHTRRHGISVALVSGVMRSGSTTRTTTGQIVHTIHETAA